MPSSLTLAAGSPAIHPVIRQILFNRGITSSAEIQSFLANHYLQSRDPFKLADMDRAVDRIVRALHEDEKIVVYGDFDADGVTATVLLLEALRDLADNPRNIRPYIPDRVDEGYGLNMDALTNLREKKVSLVISVDCGIRSNREVAHAQAIGLDMIITDHHSLGRELPPAVAVVNPKRHDSEYPEKMLAGVGIAFKLAQALRQAMPGREAVHPESNLLDLVAIGTVADLAPLTGENRVLVAEGLAVLNELRRPGLAALANISNLQPGKLSAEDIGFALGPRINAAGRLTHANDAAKLLVAVDQRSAHDFAHALDALNRQRQTLTQKMTAMAEEQIDPSDPIIIARDPEFLPGIVGLVAGRLSERAYRPTIIMEQGDEESRGSCRSIPEFHITRALDEVADLLVRHGGHAQAAGFTIRNENVPEFIDRIKQLAGEELDGQDLRPTLSIEASLPLDQVDWALHDNLKQLEPTGTDNPKPLLLSRAVEVVSHRTVGTNGAHLQLFLVDAHRNGPVRYSGSRAQPGQAFPAIAFRQGEWAGMLPRQLDIVYYVNVNNWQGKSNLQLVIEDIRPAEGESPTP